MIWILNILYFAFVFLYYVVACPMNGIKKHIHDVKRSVVLISVGNGYVNIIILQERINYGYFNNVH